MRLRQITEDAEREISGTLNFGRLAFWHETRVNKGKDSKDLTIFMFAMLCYVVAACEIAFVGLACSAPDFTLLCGRASLWRAGAEAC